MKVYGAARFFKNTKASDSMKQLVFLLKQSLIEQFTHHEVTLMLRRATIVRCFENSILRN